MARYFELTVEKATELGLIHLPRRLSKDKKKLMYFEDDLFQVGDDKDAVAEDKEIDFLSEREAVNITEKRY